QIRQPIAPLEGTENIPLNIPLELNLKKETRWTGNIAKIYSLTIDRIPDGFGINPTECSSFEITGRTIKLKQEILDKINSCAEKQEDNCEYDMNDLRFTCELIMSPEAYSDSLLASRQIVA